MAIFSETPRKRSNSRWVLLPVVQMTRIPATCLHLLNLASNREFPNFCVSLVRWDIGHQRHTRPQWNVCRSLQFRKSRLIVVLTGDTFFRRFNPKTGLHLHKVSESMIVSFFAETCHRQLSEEMTSVNNTLGIRRRLMSLELLVSAGIGAGKSRYPL